MWLVKSKSAQNCGPRVCVPKDALPSRRSGSLSRRRLGSRPLAPPPSVPPRPPEKAVDFATHFTWPVFGQVTLTLPFGGILTGETLATQTRASRQRTETMQARGCAQRGRGAELTTYTASRAFRCHISSEKPCKTAAKQVSVRRGSGSAVMAWKWYSPALRVHRGRIPRVPFAALCHAGFL